MKICHMQLYSSLHYNNISWIQGVLWNKIPLKWVQLLLIFKYKKSYLKSARATISTPKYNYIKVTWFKRDWSQQNTSTLRKKIYKLISWLSNLIHMKELRIQDIEICSYTCNFPKIITYTAKNTCVWGRIQGRTGISLIVKFCRHHNQL